MKCSYSPFSAASADSSLTLTARSTELPLASRMRTDLAAHFGDVAFFQEQEAARHRQQRGRIRRNEILARHRCPITTGQPMRAQDQPVRLVSLSTTSA